MQSSILIGVTGPRGRLGSELVRQGCVPIVSNVLNYGDLYKEISTLKPDVIIHCAAYTNVDGCELAPKHASEINTGGTYTLASAFPGKIVYISTDYIFDGEDGPYDERAKPNPINIYGWSKSGGEIVLKNRNNHSDLIVRITTPFGVHPAKPMLVSRIIQRLQNNKTLVFSDNLVSSPSYIPYLARGMLQAIQLDMTGVLNLAGDEAMSLMQFAQVVADIWGFDPALIKSGEYNAKAPRPQEGGLIVGKAIKNGVFIGNYLDGLQEMVNALETMEAG